MDASVFLWIGGLLFSLPLLAVKIGFGLERGGLQRRQILLSCGMYLALFIGVTGWMSVARLVRAEFLSLKERDFTVAEKALGARDFRIIFRHILPNAMAPILVSATLGVAGAILTESALSFLGIGVQPPTPSWGNILTAGKDNIEIAWWLSLYPGLAILITVLGYNLLGEGIRDAIDPRLKQ